MHKNTNNLFNFANEICERMKERRCYRFMLFFVLFVICLLNSHTVGNSFAVQGSPSGIVRLKISKSIKGFKVFSLNDLKRVQRTQMNLAISENRQVTATSPHNDNVYLSQSKTNKYEQIVDLYRKEKNTQNLRYLFVSTKQVLRI